MNKDKNLNYINLPLVNKDKVYIENKKQEKNKLISKVFVILIIIALIILMLFCGYSMAKMVDEVIVKSKAEIAEPILFVESSPELDITAANNSGIYTFRIKNYDEKEKITETDLKYYIEILSDADDSINIELYEKNNKIELKNNKTEYMNLYKDKKENKEYQVKHYMQNTQ